MKRIFIFLFIVVPFVLSAQLDEDNEYNKEFIWGFHKNSNGGTIGGFVFRWSQKMGTNVYRTFGLELSNVHHPKEFRHPSRNGSTFIFGKTNYLYTIRLQYGRDKIFFKKDTQQGVQINAGFSGGLTVGLQSPYYIQNADGEYEEFDPQVHLQPAIIQGPGKLFQGLNQAKTVLGVNVRGGVSFEFGSYKNNVSGLEVGIMIEAFTRKIILVPTQNNRALFSSVYATLYRGRRK